MEALVEAGVTQVVLAVSYRAQEMEQELSQYAEQLGVKLIFSHETEPLGTAGPLALAKDVLGQDDEPFFVLNSDITCEFPFKEMVAFHKSHGHEGTIVVSLSMKLKLNRSSSSSVLLHGLHRKIDFR